MPDTITTAAITAALKCDWASAISANTKILKDHPTDIDCLNRLGKAYLETGNCKKAAFYFRKVLRIDKYNPIAQKNLARSGDSPPKKSGNSSGYANFLEEPGKTRLVTLVNTAPAATLLRLDHADHLTLVPKRHTVIVTDSEENYLGALPDDLGHRLGVLIKGGNRYEAIAKSVTKCSIVVFLREILRAKRFHNTPSFLAQSSPDYLSFLREETVSDQPKPTTTEPEDADEMAVPDHHQDEESEAS